MRWRVLIPVVVVIGLVALLGYSLTRDPTVLPSALLNKPAPAFDLPTLTATDSKQRIDQQVLKGRVTLVNVWASWCVSCRAENDIVTEVSQRTGVPVLGIDYKDKRADAQRWLSRFGDPFAIVGFDHSGGMGIDWGVAAVPETFVIDAEGIIRYKVVGPISRDEMESRLIPKLKALQKAS